MDTSADRRRASLQGKGRRHGSPSSPKEVGVDCELRVETRWWPDGAAERELSGNGNPHLEESDLRELQNLLTGSSTRPSWRMYSFLRVEGNERALLADVVSGSSSG